jgi:hypothetical protein
VRPVGPARRNVRPVGPAVAPPQAPVVPNRRNNLRRGLLTMRSAIAGPPPTNAQNRLKNIIAAISGKP